MLDIRTRFGLTYEAVRETDNEYTDKAMRVLERRLNNNDFSEFSEWESDAIAYAFAFDEDNEEEETEFNEYLTPMVQEMGISNELAQILEAIGIKITSDGQDCHRYGLKGSPIDIEYICNNIQKIREAKFDAEMGYKYLVVDKTTIHEWAYLIQNFWDKYPNYE